MDRKLPTVTRSRQIKQTEPPTIDESTVLRRFRDTDPEIIRLVLEELIKHGLMREKSAPEQNHKKRATYELTDRGFVWALKSSKLESFDSTKWRNIAHSYCHLFPSFLGKWDHFVQNGAEEMAIETLQNATEHPLIWDPRQNMGAPMIAIDRLESEFVFPTPSYDMDAVFHTIVSTARGDNWLRAVTRDIELAELAAKLAWERYNRYDELARMWKHISQTLRKLQSDPSIKITVSDLWSYKLESDPTAAAADLLLKMHDKLQPARFRILSFWLGRAIRPAP